MQKSKIKIFTGTNHMILQNEVNEFISRDDIQQPAIQLQTSLDSTGKVIYAVLVLYREGTLEDVQIEDAEVSVSFSKIMNDAMNKDVDNRERLVE